MSDYSCDITNGGGTTIYNAFPQKDAPGSCWEVPLAGILAPTVYYKMMARNSDNNDWLRWTVTNTADWLGVHAGETILAGSAVVLY